MWVCLALSFKEGAGLSVVVCSTCNPSTQKNEIEGPLGLGDLLNLYNKTPPPPKIGGKKKKGSGLRDGMNIHNLFLLILSWEA